MARLRERRKLSQLTRPRDRTHERGYGADHQRHRRQIAPFVASGKAVCARCGEPILPSDAWDLDHDDVDKTKYLGPSHARCNRATAGRAIAHSRRW